MTNKLFRRLAVAGLLFAVNIPAMVSAAAPAKAAAVSVDVIEVTAGKALLQREIPGRTSAFKMAEIRPRVTGIITERLFVEGSAVDAGQQLYQIDPAPYAATYQKTQADLQKAVASEKAVLVRKKRLQELVSSKSVSQQDFDDVQTSLDLAKADIAIARAAVSSARIDLDYTEVRAPIDGRTGKSQFTSGALVTMNQEQALTRIIQLDPIYVDMTLSSNELMQLRPYLGEEKKITIKLLLDYDGSEYQHTGELQFADVSVDQSTGSVQLRALFPNPDEALLPGMFVRAKVELALDSIFKIPQTSAQRNTDGSLYVWVIDDNNLAQQRTIEVARTLGSQWMVRSGLQSGDKVVTAGMLKLKQGSAVSVDDSQAK